jgi:RNA polymerase II elongation factor ELL.
MAGLVEGVQYVLSSHGHFHENKSLIFVRLTDSAYRAIEDFLRKKVRHIMIRFVAK